MPFRPFHLPALARAPDGAAGGAGAPDTPQDTGAGAPDINLLDSADPAPAAGPDGKPQRPEDVPEAFWDAEKGAIRPDALVKSWRDLRKQISRGEHKPPAAADAYTLPAVEGLPEDFLGGENDALLPGIREAALKAGLTVQQFQAIAQPFLGELAKRLADTQPMDPAAEAEAVAAYEAAEIAKLGPNGKLVVAQLRAQLDGLQARGTFTPGERAALRLGTAEAVLAVQKLLQLAGEKPIPLDGLAPGLASQADLERMLREGYAKNDDNLVRKAREGLQALAGKGLLRDPRAPG